MEETLEAGAPIYYFTIPASTAPSPAPGVVTEVTGDDDYTVRITLADDRTQIEEHVGSRAANPERYIKPREEDAGEPPAIEPGGDLGGEIGG